MSVAYLNGAYLPLADARISPLDRGFLFADGIYEVAAVIDGKLVRVLSWYDNEWGFSNRMIDTAGVMAKFL